MRSIKSKVILVQVSLAVLISVLLGFSSYFIMARIFIATARDNLILIGMEEAMELSQRIDDHREFFRDVAREELMEFYHPQFNAMGLVEHFAHFSDNFSSLSFAGLDGKEVARLVKGKVSREYRDLSGRPFFQFALARPGEVAATDPNDSPPRIRFVSSAAFARASLSDSALPPSFGGISPPSYAMRT